MSRKMTSEEQAVWQAAYGTAFAMGFDRDAQACGFAAAVEYRRSLAMRAEATAYNAVHAFRERTAMNPTIGTEISETPTAPLVAPPVDQHDIRNED